MLHQQRRKSAVQTTTFSAKGVASAIKSLMQKVYNTHMGRAAALHRVLFHETNHPTRPHNTLKLADQPRPVPGAYKTDTQALIHQIKGGRWKRQRFQGVHDMKGDTPGDLLVSGTLTRIINHLLANIDTDQ